MKLQLSRFHIGVLVLGAIIFAFAFFSAKKIPPMIPDGSPIANLATSTLISIPVATSSQPIPLKNVLVADTEALRELGLGQRATLPEDSGMLFVFDHADTYGFWMKDMEFPLDIIWLDQDFRVIHIERDLSPETYPKIFTPTAKASFVLEVNAGIAEKNNYTEGKTLDFLRALVYTK
jgi:uncharacterized protein